MSLRERSGRWHYRFKLRGICYAGTTGLVATKQSKNVAKAVEAQRRLEIEQRVNNKICKELPFSIAATEFLKWCHSTEYRCKPNTAKRLSGSFASLVPFFTGLTVREITAIQIERYKTFRANEHHVKDVTLRNDLNALSLFFGYAVRAGWCGSNPLLGNNKVKRPSGEDAVRMHVLTCQEEGAYFSAARNRKNLHDLAKLILLQGARPEEILSLKKSSYSREKGTIKILGGKTKSAGRELILCGEAVEIIERRLDSDSPWLFPSQRKPECHIVQMAHTHDSVCQDAGVSFVLYDLRHTFATRMAEAGVDLVTLATILGHSSLRIVQKYVHPTAQNQRSAMRKYELLSLNSKPE